MHYEPTDRQQLSPTARHRKGRSALRRRTQHRCVHPQARRWAKPLAAEMNWQGSLPLLPVEALG